MIEEADFQAADAVPEELSAEEAQAKTLRQPLRPSPEEVAAHELSHLTYAPWCGDCVSGRGREDAHRPTGGRVDAIQPLIALDYFFLGGDRRKGKDKATDSTPVGLAAIDTSNGALWGSMVIGKGAAFGTYPALALTSWLRELGHIHITLQTDGEPAIQSLVDLIRERLASGNAGVVIDRVAVQTSPVDSHASNGAVERSIQTLRGLARTYIAGLERRCGQELPANSVWWCWAMRHAAWLYNRFHRKRSQGNLTPYEKYKHRKYGQPILQLAAAVWARRPGAALNKAGAPLIAGLWLGRDSVTDEHVIATGAGVFRTRTVKRKPLDAEWDKEAILGMTWEPWNTGRDIRGRKPLQHQAREPILAAPLPTNPAEHAFKRQDGTAGTAAAAAAPSRAADPPPQQPSGSSGLQVPRDAAGRLLEEHSIATPPRPTRERPDSEDTPGAVQAGKRQKEMPLQGAVRERPDSGDSPGQCQADKRQKEMPQQGEVRERSPTAGVASPGTAQEGKRPRGETEVQASAVAEAIASAAEPPGGAAAAPPPGPTPKRRGRPPKVKPSTEMLKGEIDAITKLIDEPDTVVDLERDPDAARQRARQTHLQTMKDMSVYEPVRLAEAQSRPITIKWVDRPEKSPPTARLTARGYEQPGTYGQDFYAATPATGTLRMLVALAIKNDWVIGVGDTERAFLQAPLPEGDPPLYVWPPADANEEADIVWKLLKALPGLKGSAKTWGSHASDKLYADHALEQSKLDECIYYGAGLVLMRHMGDFVVAGERTKVKEILEALRETLLVSGTEVLEYAGQKVQILGRLLTKTQDGFTISCSPKLLDEVVAAEGLETAKSVRLPGEKMKEMPSDKEELDDTEHRHYRQQVGRLLWLSADRADLQHAVMRLSRSVGSPTRGDARSLKRLVRYLHGTRDWVQHLVGGGAWQVVGSSDADWAAGDRIDRRSVTGGIIKVGGVMIASFSRIQQSTALSSGESELMAMTSVAAECMYWQGVLEEIGHGPSKTPWCLTDSSAALGAAGRSGPKRMKHIELRRLVAHEWAQADRIRFLKIGTKENEADLLTKFVSGIVLATLTRSLGLRPPS